MAKTPLEKQIEKARKEAKKVEQQEATRQRAATIISNQPIINGLRIVDDTAETVLNCLIDNCNNTSSGYVNYDSDMFPQSVSRSIGLEIEKLIQYGLVTSHMPWPNGGTLNLLPCAFTYSDRKRMALCENQSEAKNMNPVIFISHRSTDKSIADMLVDFFSATGIPRTSVFCSSLPGNDINEKISAEVKAALMNSVINIAILSADYYQSAYCLNEAGVLWYCDNVPVIPIALPEINESNMYGFLNSEYKLRRLDSSTDIAYIYDKVCEAVSATQSKVSIITYETQKIKDRYAEYLSSRPTPTPQPLTICLDNLTTDDERIVLFYILQANVRKVSKSTVIEWLNNNEIYNVNIDNAFDLLSSQGGQLQEETLTLSIEAFREYSQNAASLLQELKPYVDEHIKLASDTFARLWDDGSFDSTVKLFVAYIVDEKMCTFGDRWMATGQVESIKQWESKNTLFSPLGDNYGSCLELFKQNDLVYESSWTSYGNPREYTLCPSLRKLLFTSPNPYSEELQNVKDEHYCNLPF